MNTRHLTFLLLLLGSVFIAMPKAHAGVGRDRATGQAIWDAAISARTTNIGGAGGTWQVIGPAGAATAGTAAGSAKIAGTATVKVADKAVPVNVSGEIVKDAIAGGVAGCLTGSIAGCVLGTLTPLAIGYMSLSGLRQNPTTGAPEYTDPKTCTAGTCYFWGSPTFPSGSTPLIYKTGQAACEAGWASYVAWVGQKPTSGPFATVTAGTQSNPTAFGCYGTNPINPVTPVQLYILNRGSTRAPESSTWFPVTEQAAKDALYQNNPPVGVVDELAKYGNIIWPSGKGSALTNPIVTGPAFIDGPKTVTNRPDGSKVTKQDRTNYSYSGPEVTKTGTTTTTTTTAPDGTTVVSTETSTTTESASDQPAPDKPEEAPSDTPLPALPNLYTRKYPDGIEGIWNEKKAEFQNSALMALKDQLLPSLGSGGTCPAWNIDLNFNTWASYGTTNVAPPCWVWDFGKVVTILGAMFLARALIFGG